MSSAGVIAAVAAQQQMSAEEEEMSNYSPEDLENDWEFKIVRANTGVFGNPQTLSQLLEEEARAGWIMVEKFDNSRIRFKRPRGARQKDSELPAGVDPYRVHYGMSSMAFALLIAAIALFGAFAVQAIIMVTATLVILIPMALLMIPR